MASTAVRVALRVRPLTQKEQFSNCTECISFIPNQPQILIGKDHSFTYDYIFDTYSEQQPIYDTSVVPLAEKFVDGFNATILAYGQTGSGKTYSMGTALDETTNSEHQGIVPRFIHDLFNRLESKKQSKNAYDYQVYVSFLELYNEDFVDLLNSASQQHNRNHKKSNTIPPCEVQIREDVNGNIYWSGVREEPCSSPDELLKYLAKGSLCRTTGSTDMNSVSSRSHAIFSVILKQVSALSDENDMEEQTVPQSPSNDELRTIVSKFHFVDLAGSERLKRTNAQGDRAREGISINSGLLALGNVISALGDESRKSAHVPYRDSKLTRLLQDSLGGNSQTLMMACVSPSDSNFLETLSTLKYANRARNIKNKVTVNQEFAGSSVEVNRLRAQVARLKLEISSLRTTGASNVGAVSSSDMMIHHMLHKNADNNNFGAAKILKEKIDRLKEQVTNMSDDICRISTERDSLLMERELSQHMNNENWPNLLDQLQQQRPDTSNENTFFQLPIISQYQKTIQDLKTELEDTKERLAFSESIRSPLMHAVNMTSTTPSASFKTSHIGTIKKHTSSTTRRRVASGGGSNVVKKRRNANGSATTSRNVTFRSTRRSKVPNMASSNRKQPNMLFSAGSDHENEDEDIESWLKATLGSLQNSESTTLRFDAKQSISNAKSQIDKALKVLDEFKAKEPEQIEYECDLLADNELFQKLQSEDNQSVFGDIEDESASGALTRDQLQSNKPTRSRMASSDTFITVNTNDDFELAEFYESNPQFRKMFDQIQSDIQVNEELVVQLEKTQGEYSKMRAKFEKKIFSLQDKITNLHQQQQQESANNATSSATSYNVNNVRHAYESKIKTLMNQLSDLRRKYSQTNSTIQSSRNQNATMLRALRVNVESLKIEKRRMVKRMKDEAERVKEKIQTHKREIEQMRRKQSKDADVRRRLEREVKQMQIAIQKKTDESVVTAEKLKSLVKILKKAVREGGVLDENLLANCSSLLDIGSALIQSAQVGRMSRNRRMFSGANGGRSKRRQQSVLSVEVRATKKKALLDNALYQFIQGKQAVEEMKQLLSKRNDLSQRKIEYISERELLVLDESKDLSSIDHAFRQVIDENIETVEAEISYLNARIHAIHNDAAAEIMQEDEQEEVIVVDMSRPERRVTFADPFDAKTSKKELAVASEPEDEWLDMDALEERYSLPSSAGPEQSLEMISKLLKSMTDDESNCVMESVIDDVVILRMEEHNNKMSLQQLEKSNQDLRRTLIVMKKAAIDTTIENEKKLKRLQQQNQGGSSRRTSMSREMTSSKLSDHSSASSLGGSSDADSAIDLYPEEHYQHVEIMFERIYNDGINGKISSYEGLNSMGCEPISPAVAMAENELSPYLKPYPVTVANATGKPTAVAPMKPSVSPLVGRRDSTSSPEQFLMQLLQTPKDARPPSSPLMRPAQFNKYQQEREISSSSLSRSRNSFSVPRRASFQSDNGAPLSIISNHSQQMTRVSSGGSVNRTMTDPTSNNDAPPTILNRRRAFSLQQSTAPPTPPVTLRRRSLLRELTNMTNPPSSEGNAKLDYSSNGTALIPAFNNSSVISPTNRPHSVLALHAMTPRPASKVGQNAILSKRSSFDHSMVSNSPDNSYELRRSAAANNVFDRLSSGHTQASHAKKQPVKPLGPNHRYSSSSLDDLRKQWANELIERQIE